MGWFMTGTASRDHGHLLIALRAATTTATAATAAATATTTTTTAGAADIPAIHDFMLFPQGEVATVSAREPTQGFEHDLLQAGGGGGGGGGGDGREVSELACRQADTYVLWIIQYLAHFKSVVVSQCSQKKVISSFLCRKHAGWRYARQHAPAPCQDMSVKHGKLSRLKQREFYHTRIDKYTLPPMPLGERCSN